MSVYEQVFTYIRMQNFERSLSEPQRGICSYAEEDEATKILTIEVISQWDQLLFIQLKSVFLTILLKCWFNAKATRMKYI